MSQAQSTPAAITELKASAHLMLLEPGVFCVFNTPGAARPDARTGLPGVRVSVAPATGGLSGEVSLTGFGRDGWIDGADGAALVRVTGGPAQVLVTVYQSTDGSHEPPKLQVLRLTEGATSAAPQPQAQGPAQGSAQGPAQQPAQAQAPQSGQGGPFEVAAHIYGQGDVAGRLGEWMGERGSKRWIEGFGLQPARGVPVSDIEYQAVLGRGWLSPWVEGGQFCGSRGMSLPILGLRIRLKGDSAQRYSAIVAATFVDGTQVGPVTDGAACEAPSLAALESFVVVIQPKQEPAAPRPAQQQPARPQPPQAQPRQPQPPQPQPPEPQPPQPQPAAPQAAPPQRAPQTAQRAAEPEPAPKRRVNKSAAAAKPAPEAKLDPAAKPAAKPGSRKRS